jgi:uncharacterized membrane protein
MVTFRLFFLPLHQNGQHMTHPLLLAIIPAVLAGILNGLYWRKRGYTGWHLYYLGAIAFYVICATAFKKLSGI